MIYKEPRNEFLELTGFNIEDVMKQIDEEFEDLDDIKEEF